MATITRTAVQRLIPCTETESLWLLAILSSKQNCTHLLVEASTTVIDCLYEVLKDKQHDVMQVKKGSSTAKY